jgi:hyperosmotically inducible protein
MMKKTLTYALSAALSVSLISVAAMPAFAGDPVERSAGQVIDDASIAARTKAAFATDPITDAIDIDIEVDNDQVQLNGFVDSLAARDRAGEIAASIDGVTVVSNNLLIQNGERSPGDYIDDKALTASVKAALADDPTAHALKIDVEVNQGIVSLGGHVDSEAERIAAVNATAQVDGVVRVINNLDVRSPS